MSSPVPGRFGPKLKGRRISLLPASLRRSRIRSTGTPWTWPEIPVVRGKAVALEPVTDHNKHEWWDTWTPDVLEAMGVDQEAHDEAGRSIGSAGVTKQLDGFAAIRALDSDGKLCKVVGGVGAVGVDDSTVELGLWLIPQHRGWGAGSDTLRIAIDHWQRQGFSAVIFTDVANEPMISVAKKLGLQRIGAVARTMPNGSVVHGVEFGSGPAALD